MEQAKMGLDIPGYKILRTLGRGGMATVFLAEQEIFEREVALKVMSKALAEDESFGKRFFREAKIVSQLVHPNIVTVHDVGQHRGNFYLSMEFIDGSDLKNLRAHMRLPEKIRAVIDIARALGYAGSKGYVHRDIKPENILINKSDGRAVLTDFGIARAAETDTTMTQTGTAIGTPHYMSPEQAKGQSVDPRSDIYSLGVVFFQLLTGHVPFDAESAVAIGIKHITEPVPLLPEGMEALQPIIDTLLAKKPDVRYQTAEEFIEDMEHIDAALLEQTLNYVRTETQQRLSGDSDSTTQTSAVVAPEDLILFEDREDSGGSVIPWLVGFLIVLSLAGWLLYFQRPDWVEPWLQQARDAAVESYHKASRWLATPDEESREATQPAVESEAQQVDLAALDKQSIAATPTREPVATLAPTVKPTPKPRAPAAKPTVSLTSYERQLSSLQRSYANDPVYLAELVKLYRAIIRDYPREKRFSESLATLRSEQVAELKNLIAAQKTQQAEKSLKQIRALFPEVGRSKLASYQNQLAAQKKTSRLLSEADKLMAAKRLTKPSGNSALDKYREVLKIQADNPQAREGLASIAAYYVGKGRDDYERGDLSRAEEKANKAVAIDPSSQAAKSLQKKIASSLAHQREMDRLFARAKSRLEQKNFFTPKNDNAFHYYQQILAREPSNTAAITGQKMVIDSFARNIWSLVGSEQFARVKRELAEAQTLMPNNERLKSLAVAVDEVVAEKM